MPIPYTAALIVDCWTRAEKALQAAVREKFPDRDEENITDLFHAELEILFREVSGRGAVAAAFLKDLTKSFPWAADGDLSRISNGLVATVDFHSRDVETKTGGDLGIVLVRPDVKSARYSIKELLTEHEHKRGLLIQAKIFQRSSRWQGLSKTQKRILRAKLEYSGLLLYRYTDHNGERRELEPFRWQLTNNATIEQISTWLVSDDFPSIQSSKQVLTGLSDDRIGTDDEELIEMDIAPPRLRPSLKIKVRWKEGTPPPPGRMHIHEKHSSVHQPQHLRHIC